MSTRFGLLINPSSGDYLLDLLIKVGIHPNLIVSHNPHYSKGTLKKIYHNIVYNKKFKQTDKAYYTAKRLNIPFFSSQDVNKNAFVDLVKEQKIDFLFVFTFKIIKPDIVKKLEVPIYNFHSSFLPYRKGINPFFYEALNNDTFAGFTIHKLTEKIDRGEIYYQKKILLSGMEDSFILKYMTLYQGAYDAIQFIIKLLNRNSFQAFPNQDGFYDAKPNRNNFLVSPKQSSEKVLNLVRAARGSGYAFMIDGSERRYIEHAFQIQPTDKIEETNDIKSILCSDSVRVILVLQKQ